jgi:hypothetical protein
MTIALIPLSYEQLNKLSILKYDRFFSWAVWYSNGNWKALSSRPVNCVDALQNLYRTVTCVKEYDSSKHLVYTWISNFVSITTVNGTVWLGQMNRKLSFREWNIYSEEWKFRWSLKLTFMGREICKQKNPFHFTLNKHHPFNITEFPVDVRNSVCRNGFFLCIFAVQVELIWVPLLNMLIETVHIPCALEMKLCIFAEYAKVLHIFLC